MKELYLIGGTMGVGKTTTSRSLMQKLDNSVFLDGDWCWEMHPFQVTDETKQMVMDNICYLLNNYLKCSAYDNIIFCWVMHEQSIIDTIIARLNTVSCRVHPISLTCRQAALAARLTRDVEAGIRTVDILRRSAERLPLYDKLSTLKVDVSDMTPDQAADYIRQNG